jgi:hypothetical protein
VILTCPVRASNHFTSTPKCQRQLNESYGLSIRFESRENLRAQKTCHVSTSGFEVSGRLQVLDFLRATLVLVTDCFKSFRVSEYILASSSPNDSYRVSWLRVHCNSLQHVDANRIDNPQSPCSLRARRVSIIAISSPTVEFTVFFFSPAVFRHLENLALFPSPAHLVFISLSPPLYPVSVSLQVVMYVQAMPWRNYVL